MTASDAAAAAVPLDDCLSCCVDTCIDSLLETKRTDAESGQDGAAAAGDENSRQRLARIEAKLSWLIEQKRELTSSGADLLHQLQACSRLAGQIRAIQIPANAARCQEQRELESRRQLPQPQKQPRRNFQLQQPQPQAIQKFRQQQQQPMQHRLCQPPQPHQCHKQLANPANSRLMQPPSRSTGGHPPPLPATRAAVPKQQPQPQPRRRYRTESASIIAGHWLSRSPHQTVSVGGTGADLLWRRSEQQPDALMSASASPGGQPPAMRLFLRLSQGGPGRPAGEVRRSFNSVNGFGSAVGTVV